VEPSLLWNPGDPPRASTLEGEALDTTGHDGILSTFSLVWPFGLDGGSNAESPARATFVGLDLYAPGGVTPLHAHPDREKLFMVLDGHARVTVGDESRVLTSAGLAFVPVNVLHGFENVGEGNLRIMQVITWLAAPAFTPGEG
jgi:hypothetical protein